MNWREFESHNFISLEKFTFNDERLRIIASTISLMEMEYFSLYTLRNNRKHVKYMGKSLIKKKGRKRRRKISRTSPFQEI